VRAKGAQVSAIRLGYRPANLAQSRNSR
jgi:hypothetical protein